MTVTSQQIETPAHSSTFTKVNQLLGGRSVLRKTILDAQGAHDLVAHGLPAASMLRLVDNLHSIALSSVLMVLGISERSFARRKAKSTQLLGVEESSRLWQFAELLAQATQVLGSQDAAEEWFAGPAIGLNGQRPIDLIATVPGARLVTELLTRMEYGVYT